MVGLRGHGLDTRDDPHLLRLFQLGSAILIVTACHSELRLCFVIEALEAPLCPQSLDCHGSIGSQITTDQPREPPTRPLSRPTLSAANQAPSATDLTMRARDVDRQSGPHRPSWNSGERGCDQAPRHKVVLSVRCVPGFAARSSAAHASP
jgi:hypothetical protein